VYHLQREHHPKSQNRTYLYKCEDSQYCIRFPVAPDNGFGKFGCPEFFGCFLHFLVPAAVEKKKKMRKAKLTTLTKRERGCHKTI